MSRRIVKNRSVQRSSTVQEGRQSCWWEKFRVLPGFAFIIMFMKLMFERLSHGPMWNHDEMADRCEKYWWKNILFINNLFSATETVCCRTVYYNRRDGGGGGERSRRISFPLFSFRDNSVVYCGSIERKLPKTTLLFTFSKPFTCQYCQYCCELCQVSFTSFTYSALIFSARET